MAAFSQADNSTARWIHGGRTWNGMEWAAMRPLLCRTSLWTGIFGTWPNTLLLQYEEEFLLEYQRFWTNSRPWIVDTEWCWPLLSSKGRFIPFVPLLRTRKVLKYVVLHALWTLYPPHALVWTMLLQNSGDISVHRCRDNSKHIGQNLKGNFVLAGLVYFQLQGS